MNQRLIRLRILIRRFLTLSVPDAQNGLTSATVDNMFTVAQDELSGGGLIRRTSQTASQLSLFLTS